MESEFNIDSQKTKNSKSKFIHTLVIFWRKIYKTIFFLFLVFSILLGGYVWRNVLLNGSWSVEKKQQYLDGKNKGVIFDEKSFQKAIVDLKARKIGNEDYQPLRDVFKAY